MKKGGGDDERVRNAAECIRTRCGLGEGITFDEEQGEEDFEHVTTNARGEGEGGGMEGEDIPMIAGGVAMCVAVGLVGGFFMGRRITRKNDREDIEKKEGNEML